MYDVIVLGVGGMGSATVYELAKRGKRVLGLERFDVPHELGSSHGVTRIIRLAYYENGAYVPLLERAYELWRELEKATGEKVLHVTGSIDAGPEDDWVFKGSHESCLEHGIPHEVLDAKELHKRFPGYQLPNGHFTLLQEEGGFLTPERCIVSFVTAAQALGAEVRAREGVLEWRETKNGVTVRTERGTFTAAELVVTAGAWAASQVPGLAGSAQPERQVLGWFQPHKPELFTPERFPVFNLAVEEGRYYGFPVYGVPGFKIGLYHHLLEAVDPDHLDRDVHPRDEAVLRDCVARYFPEANGSKVTLKTCLFTNSPDEHFIIGRHPDFSHVSFAAGFSGHGFKFCSVVGEVLADLAVQGETRHPVGLFSPRRYLTSTVH